MMRKLTILAVAVVLAGCGRNTTNVSLDQSRSDRHLDETTFDTNALAMVQRDTGIRLPAGARGLSMFYQGSTLDPSFVAKIAIPVAAGDEMATCIGTIPNQDGTVSGSLTEKVSWWTPTNGTIRIQRQSNPAGNFLRAILSQEKDGLVLYVEWIKI